MKSFSLSHISLFHLLVVHTLLIFSTNAQICFPGTFRNASSCSPCPLATWQEGFTPESCQPCPSGQTTLSTGSHGRDLCTVCPVGTFMDGTLCRPCPSGTTSRSGSTEVSNCLACGPGMRLSTDGRRCEQCPAGTFSSEELNFECSRCPPRTFSASGSQSIDACEEIVCPPGKDFNGNGGCDRCVEGRFKSERSSDLCVDCPLGFFSPLGARECTPCPSGTFASLETIGCERCGHGLETRGEGATVCRRRRGPCPIDAIEKADGACVRCSTTDRINLTTGFCERCPLNSVAIAANATECIPCPVGMTVEFGLCECPPGSMLTDGRCRLCKPGTTSSSGSSCSRCSPELVAFGRGATQCQECPVGLIASEDGSRCIPCPEGTALNIGLSIRGLDMVLPSIDQCRDIQTGCPIGYDRPPGSGSCVIDLCRQVTDETLNCRRCDPGSRPIGNRSNFRLLRCDRCRFGSASDGFRCRRCPRNMTNVSRDGSRCICGDGMGIRNGRCTECPPGTYSTPDDEDCVKCPVGLFSAGVASSFCRNCPVDTFSDREGANHCEACPAGTFTYGEGESKCLEFLE